MKPTMLIGAPGTGKTRGLVQKILERRPERFALVSFTKRAANEAKQRLRPYYSDSELRYVRTIHSLCFELLGLRTTQVVTFQHLREFGEQYGYMFTHRTQSQEDDGYYGLTEDDISYRRMQIEIAKMQIDAYDEELYTKYTKYKKDNHLIDYHDMLIQACRINLPKFDVLGVDEIQDLTPLQLYFVSYLVNQSDNVIYAGDGNQMIFEWAGVDRQRFIDLKMNCGIEWLLENYRLPYGLNQYANKILGYDPHGHIACSSVFYKSYLPDINSNETYLILARNNYILRNLLIYDGEFIQHPWTWLSLDENPRIKIKLSTIHGAKGAEADNVILFSDVSPATYENIESEAERRVWYVGITRARKKLYIIEPQTDTYFDLS